MQKLLLPILLILLSVSLPVNAQQTVTGRVIDSSDGQPLPGASVFISGTTIGTSTDSDGNFSLTAPIQGSFEVAVHFLGFQPASRTIDTSQDTHIVNFALLEQVTVLQELVVTAGSPARRRHEDLFWRLFLGERPSNRGMQVLNPEVVEFSLTPLGNLRVFAEEPIEIINHNIGYRISYVLQQFEHDFRLDQTRLMGMPLFTELTPQNDRQQRDWERNRALIYSTSLTSFIRSLYHQQLAQHGFLLAQITDGDPQRLTSLALTPEDITRMRIPARRVTTERESPFSYQTILQRDEEGTRFILQQSAFLGFLSTPVTFIMFEDPHTILFRRGATFPLIRIMPTNVIIYADGSYSGRLHIIEYRDTVFGIRARLPIEYGLDTPAAPVVRHSLRRW